MTEHTEDYAFPRKERLKSKKEIALLFEKGKGGFVYPLRYVVLRNDTEHPSASNEPGLSLLVSVSKRYHKRAPVRNLLKRRIREAYRLSRNPLRDLLTNSHWSIGLLYTSAEVADYTQIEHAVQKIIRTLTPGD